MFQAISTVQEATKSTNSTRNTTAKTNTQNPNPPFQSYKNIQQTSKHFPSTSTHFHLLKRVQLSHLSNSSYTQKNQIQSISPATQTPTSSIKITIFRHPLTQSKMGPIVLTQLATGLSVLIGAAVVKTMLDKPMAGGDMSSKCPSCNGTGRVSCMCSRWSDGDVGCRTCGGSGRMACSSCGGSGTGRPLPVQISVKNRSNRPL